VRVGVYHSCHFGVNIPLIPVSVTDLIRSSKIFNFHVQLDLMDNHLSEASSASYNKRVRY
jgi:hypothetical protein